jgi:hypothetical protein
MAVLICPGCAVANSDSARWCHCCGRNFSPHAAVLTGLITDTHGYIKPEQQYHARAARRALLSAAGACAVRAVALPWLIVHSPPRTFGSLDAESVQVNSFAMAAALYVCSLWALADPLVPSMLCLTLFVWLASPDLIHPAGLLSSGIITKVVLLILILRAVIAGLLHRMLRRRPA